MIRTTPWTARVALLTSLLWSCPSHATPLLDAFFYVMGGDINQDLTDAFVATCMTACGMTPSDKIQCNILDGDPFACHNYRMVDLKDENRKNCDDGSGEISLGVGIPPAAGWSFEGSGTLSFNWGCKKTEVWGCDTTPKAGATGNGGRYVHEAAQVYYYAEFGGGAGLTVKGPGVEVVLSGEFTKSNSGTKHGIKPADANPCSVGAPAEN